MPHPSVRTGLLHPALIAVGVAVVVGTVSGLVGGSALQGQAGGGNPNIPVALLSGGGPTPGKAIVCPTADNCKIAFVESDRGGLGAFYDCDDRDCARYTRTDLTSQEHNGGQHLQMSCPSSDRCAILVASSTRKLSFVQCLDETCTDRIETLISDSVGSRGISLSCPSSDRCRMTFIGSHSTQFPEALRMVSCDNEGCTQRSTERVILPPPQTPSVSAIFHSLSCPAPDACRIAMVTSGYVSASPQPSDPVAVELVYVNCGNDQCSTWQSQVLHTESQTPANPAMIHVGPTALHCSDASACALAYADAGGAKFLRCGNATCSQSQRNSLGITRVVTSENLLGAQTALSCPSPDNCKATYVLRSPQVGTDYSDEWFFDCNDAACSCAAYRSLTNVVSHMSLPLSCAQGNACRMATLLSPPEAAYTRNVGLCADETCGTPDATACGAPVGGGGGGGASSAAPSIAGLYAHWNYDNVTGAVVPDVSGNSRNGTNLGATIQDGCAYFDGVQDRVEVPNLDMPTFTFATWVKKANVTSTNPPLIGAANFGGWWAGYLGQGPWKLRLGVMQESGGAASDSLAAADVWQHLAYVFDRGTIRFYVSGVRDTAQPGVNPAIPNSNGGVYNLGYRDVLDSQYRYQGLMDDTRVYNVVLSDAQIAQLAAQPAPTCVIQPPASSASGGGSSVTGGPSSASSGQSSPGSGAQSSPGSGGSSSRRSSVTGSASSASSICAACVNDCRHRIAAALPKPSFLARFWSALTGSPMVAQVSGGTNPNISANNGNCIDADGGMYPMAAGETRDSTGARSADFCFSQRQVREYYCQRTGGVQGPVTMDCPVGTQCQGGACAAIPGWSPAQNPPCTETDTGPDLFTKGTTTGSNQIGVDTCESDNFLHEYYCARGTTQDITSATVVQCPGNTICQNGACIHPGGSQELLCDRCLAENCPAGQSCTPVCGDGQAIAWEECDDGNTRNGDGCSSKCRNETVCTQTQIDCFKNELRTTGSITFGHNGNGTTLMLIDETRARGVIDAALRKCNLQAPAPGNFDDAAMVEALGPPRQPNAPAAYVGSTCTTQTLQQFGNAGVTVRPETDCSSSGLGYGRWSAAAGISQEVSGIADRYFSEVLPCAVCAAAGTGTSSSAGPGRTACLNNACISIAGAGQNQCGLGSNDCSRTQHLACVGIGSCGIVDGPGGDLCNTNEQCNEMHSACVGLTCQGIPGRGTGGSCTSDAQCAIGFSSSSAIGGGCPMDACGTASGKQFCETQSKTCVNTVWPDCIRCDGPAYDCSTQDECAVGGTQYCQSLGKTCAEIPDGLCIECRSDMICPENGCYNGGEEYCTAVGKQCTPTDAPQCIACGPVPSPTCLGTECDLGGDPYCATFGKDCKEVPSSLCIECVNKPIEPIPCGGNECSFGGNEFCGIKGQACNPASNDICIQCSGGEYQCQGNECRFGGADYCGSFNKGCTNLLTSDSCIACKALGCKDSSECDFGAQCIAGKCVRTCGNGKIDKGESCDGGPGCTQDCLLGVDQQCTFDTECQSGLCTNAACDTCAEGGDCQSGQCNAGTCLILCGNGKLDPGEICDPGPAGGNDTCTAHCLLATGNACERDLECQTGLCGQSQCVGCSRGSQCESGLCVSGTCVDLCGNGRRELLEACDDGNRVTGDGCSRFCELEGAGDLPSVASQLLPVSFLGEPGFGYVIGPDGKPLRPGEAVEFDVDSLSASVSGHPAAGQTGPAALVALAGGAAAGWAWLRRRKSGGQ